MMISQDRNKLSDIAWAGIPALLFMLASAVLQRQQNAHVREGKKQTESQQLHELSAKANEPSLHTRVGSVVCRPFAIFVGFHLSIKISFWWLPCRQMACSGIWHNVMPRGSYSLHIYVLLKHGDIFSTYFSWWCCLFMILFCLFVFLLKDCNSFQWASWPQQL